MYHFKSFEIIFGKNILKLVQTFEGILPERLLKCRNMLRPELAKPIYDLLFKTFW